MGIEAPTPAPVIEFEADDAIVVGRRKADVCVQQQPQLDAYDDDDDDMEEAVEDAAKQQANNLYNWSSRRRAKKYMNSCYKEEEEEDNEGEGYNNKKKGQMIVLGRGGHEEEEEEIRRRRPSYSYKFAILLAGHASEYVRERYNGVASLFKRLLGEAGETWDTFSVIDGHFPTVKSTAAAAAASAGASADHAEEIMEIDETYDGFVITGSRHDAHGNEPWILKLCSLIQQAHKKKKKLLGICFGHQVISRALGGRTGRAANGWECGLKKIELSTEAMRSKRYWKGLLSSQQTTSKMQMPLTSLSIIEVHQDEVWEVPEGGQILGWSEKTKVEMIAVGNEVLGIQGHPEFTQDIAVDILTSSRYAALLPAQVIHQAMHSFNHGQADQDIFRQLCKAFLKDKTPTTTRENRSPTQ